MWFSSHLALAFFERVIFSFQKWMANLDDVINYKGNFHNRILVKEN